jgi:3-oxoacyl-[acyl-carrier-protein] synthase II
MAEGVVITGYSVFSAFGFGEQALIDGVFAGVPAFRPVTRFEVSRFACKYAATFDGDGPLPPGMSWEPARPATPGEIFLCCAEQALAMSADPERSGLSLIAATKLYAPSVQPEGPAAFADRLGTELGLGRPRRAFVNACVASANAVIHAAQLISCGVTPGAVVGAVHLVEQQVFAEFDAVRALSRQGSLLAFDRRRRGLLLGDSGAALVLESAASAQARGARPLARLAGWAMTDDAFHMVQPKPDGGGTAAAITQSLRRAAVEPDQLGYVNAHGTATALNDPAEVAALQASLGAHAPAVAVSSTKSTTGHALQGCGILELVITLLALRHGLLPPTASRGDLEPQGAVDLVAGVARPASIDYAMTLNSSVGGINSAIVLAAA